jgi:hypothetical protein
VLCALARCSVSPGRMQAEMGRIYYLARTRIDFFASLSRGSLHPEMPTDDDLERRAVTYRTQRLPKVTGRVLILAACALLFAEAPWWTSVRAEQLEQPGRAGTAFVDTLMRVGQQDEQRAREALRSFTGRHEPLPYLPEFVLEDAPQLDGADGRRRRVAHVGCGQATVHPYFLGAQWEEIRIDISRGNKPDIVADMTSVGQHLSDESVDAVYCAHRYNNNRCLLVHNPCILI